MKIDLNFIPKDPEGKDVGMQTVGQMVSGVLLSSKDNDESEIYKLFDWGMKLGKGEPIDLDKADQKKFKNKVLKTEMNVFFKAIVLQKLEP